MPFSLIPDRVYHRFTDVTPELLQTLDIRLLLCDLDYTLAPRSVARPDGELHDWLSACKAAGIQVMILSNNRSSRRVETFCSELGIRYVGHAGKPATRGYREAMEKAGVGEKHTAMLGDKLLTDVLGAKRSGVLALMVEPLGGPVGAWNHVLHLLQRPFKSITKKEMFQMSRFAKIAEKLEAYGLDAMLITSEPNRLYATEFHSTAGMAVVTRTGSYFFTDSRYIEAASRKIAGAEIRENNRENPMSKLANEVIEKHGVKKMGFEESYMTVEEYDIWREKLNCELIPAAGLLMELRSMKDQAEVESLVAAQRIAEKALTEALNFIKAGRSEQEIAAFLQYQMLLGGAEKMSFEPIVVSGANSSMPHGVPTAKLVEAGDFITMDFGCVVGGYCSDMTRTVAVGHVTEEMDKVYHTVLNAQLAGIAATKAGITGASVHAAAAKVIADAGYGPYFGHGYGHGVGVEIHEQPSASPANEKPLPVGAVISAEPGIYLPGRFGVRIEDVVIVEENGCRDITLAPKELIIL